jgi:hypothetical protein
MGLSRGSFVFSSITFGWYFAAIDIARSAMIRRLSIGNSLARVSHLFGPPHRQLV